MTLSKAYKSLILTVILMMTTIILYAFEVSKLGLRWGMIGFVVTTILSIFTIILSIHETKHQRDVKTNHFILKYRFEILDWFSFLAISMMVIFTIFMFFVLPSDVKHSSMMPTFKEGDRILIYHFNYEPEIGDIVIVKITQDAYPIVPLSMFYERDAFGNIIRIQDEIFFVKRIYAKSGDLVEFVNYNFQTERYEIRINGIVVLAATGEPYYVYQNQKEIMEQSLEQHVLKENLFFAFGDNANGYLHYPASYDSRSFGAIRSEDLVGKAIFKLWPFGGVS
jgi:signal peptidase I